MTLWIEKESFLPLLFDKPRQGLFLSSSASSLKDITKFQKRVTFIDNSKDTQTQKQAVSEPFLYQAYLLNKKQVKRKSTALGTPSPIKKARIQESSPRKPKGKTSRSPASASPRKRTPKTARARKLVPPSYETALDDVSSELCCWLF